MHLEVFAVIISGFIATTSMTIFSYTLSIGWRHNFKEPEILGELIRRLTSRKESKPAKISGWILHYLVGYLFVTFYSLMWENTNILVTVGNGVWMGLISGLIGIGIWHVVFKVHLNPPQIALRDYYLVLLAAHIVFGVTAALSYYR